MPEDFKIYLMNANNREIPPEKCSISFERTISYHGQPPCDLNFSHPEVGFHQFTAQDIFECLCMLRIFLEKQNYRLLCMGSRTDVYPSGASRNMNGGYKAYILKIGEIPSRDDLVKIFDAAEGLKIGTVEEQKYYYEKWLKSIKLDAKVVKHEQS